MLLVSMVMAVYNGERFIKETIGQAIAQTYPHLEIIIVNDGSIDATKSIIDEFQDPRIQVIHIEENQGAAHALNIGIDAAKGMWIAIQDVDDVSYPNRIEEQVNYILEHPNLVGVGSLIRCIFENDDTPDEKNNNLEIFRNSMISTKDIRNIIYWGCPFTHSSVMFSKQAFMDVNGYDNEFKIAYDYDLWLKLLEIGEMENVPKVLVDYRLLPHSLSNSNSLNTMNEIQIASAKAICRAIIKRRNHNARVILFGTQSGCEHFINFIVPCSGLHVIETTIQFTRKNISSAIKKIKVDEADVVIFLHKPKNKEILIKLRENQLKFNQDFYILSNIFE